MSDEPWVPTAEGPPATLREALEDCYRVDRLREFARALNVGGPTRKAEVAAAVAGRREAIVDALAECPIGVWITIGELSRHMRATGNVFEVARNPWDLYIADKNYGSLGYDGSGGWDVLQERYIMAFLLEYAAMLGVVDVAYTTPEDARPGFRSMWGTDDLPFLSRYDGLSCIRLTRLGAFVLGLVDEIAAPPAASAGCLEILPNLHVVPDGGEFEPRDETFLSTFCRRGAEGFALDRTAVAAAVEKGHRIADLAGFLERTKRLCTVNGDGSLIVVPSESEAAFRQAVREMGYPLLAGGVR
jgi:DNA-binding transcriptional ArsR family regulator